MKLRILPAALATVLAATGFAADLPEALQNDVTARVLYANCERMDIVVEQMTDDAGEIGLQRSAIRNALEERIRAAGIYHNLGPAGRQFISAGVMVVGSAFHIELALHRYVEDAGFGISGTVTVWSTGTTGTHGRNPTYIVGSLSRLIDGFIVDYLRANELACAKKTRNPPSQ